MKIYIDTADIATINDLIEEEDIGGVTTNPTLARRAGVVDYFDFAKRVVDLTSKKEVSLEVIGDTYADIVRQAHILQSLGDNVFVKVPCVYGNGESTEDAVSKLSVDGVNINATAIMTTNSARKMYEAIAPRQGILSVFAGRIADTGRDAEKAVENIAVFYGCSKIRVLWASPREIFDYVKAKRAFCDIITMPPEMYKKMKALDMRELEGYEVETAKMFLGDASASGYVL